jgi:hypothetical protein
VLSLGPFYDLDALDAATGIDAITLLARSIAVNGRGRDEALQGATHFLRPPQAKANPFGGARKVGVATGVL